MNRNKNEQNGPSFNAKLMAFFLAGLMIFGVVAGLIAALVTL